MRIIVLGQIEARGEQPMPLGGPTQRRLLGVLALHHDDVVSVDRLIDVTWQENDRPSRAERNLHTYISRLRGSLNGLGDRIETVGAGYRLHLEPGELDLDLFDELAATARRHADSGDPVEALDAVDDALALWHGRPFDEFADEPWVVAEVTRAVETQVALRELRAGLLLQMGRPGEIVADMEALAGEHPYRESPRALRMQALYHAGRQAEALRVFQTFRRELIDEVGVEPSRDLVDLDRRIASSSLEAPEPTSVRTIGAYVLGERIGEGAFAVVYRATQPTLDRDVAVKVVRAELANQPEFVRRFEAEAKMVARIEHPNVVPLYDFWREPDRAYLVMRLMTGGTLESRLDSGPLSTDVAVAVVEQVAAALGAAHDLGVVHRDVKPENVMFDADGTAYLADFGIALDAAERAHPEAALSEGSPLFASPEQLRREPVGPEADVHALGILAYAMLAGAAPFADSPDDAARLRRQLHDPIPSLRTLRPELPEAVDRVLAIATAKRPEDRYPSTRAFAVAFDTAVMRGDEPVVDVAARELANPYKGLRAFDETDAPDFRGRERLVDELLAGLSQADERLLAVVGPSGSGKSSVVRAGVLPALRAGRAPGSREWFTSSMTPGAHPFEALETALLRIAVNPPGSLLEQLQRGPRGVLLGVRRVLPDDHTTLLLVIDQFEELFTNEIDPAQVDLFLDALVVATSEPASPLRVLITLRADFFDRPLRHPTFAAALKDRTITVTPLAADELEHAIVDPATSVGVGFEPGLVARIIADVGSQPGALPLLQYALTRTFDRAEADTITEADYDGIGGLTGSLSRRADELWTAADEPEQRAIRRLFERLVNLGEGVEDTRRRVERSELGADGATAAALDRYGAARLLTFDRHPASREPTVEVAHEALIQRWPRLREWLDGDRDALRAHRHLTAAAAAWTDRGRDPSDLYRGARLDAAAQLADAGRIELNAEEQAFLGASVEQRDAEARDRHRRTLRLRRFATATALLAAVAVIAGVVAFTQRNSADDSRRLAEERAVTARVRELAASSQSVRDLDPELAILLALEAIETGGGEDLPEAEQALHDALLSTNLLATFPSGFDGVADFYPDGSAFVSVDEGSMTAVVREVDSLDVRHELSVDDGEVAGPGEISDVAVSGDGERIAAASYAAGLWIWDAHSGTLERRLSAGDGTEALVPEFSTDGSMVAVTWYRPEDGRTGVTVWDTATGEELRTVQAPTGIPLLINVEFSPDGALLAASAIDVEPGIDPGIRAWDLDTGELVMTYSGHVGQVRDMGFTPDGTRLVSGGADSTVKVFDVASGDVLANYDGHDGPVGDIEISADGTLVASSGSEVHVWELDTLARIDVNVHHAGVDGLALSPDGTRLLTASHVDLTTHLWDISPWRSRELLGLPGPEERAGTAPRGVAFAPDGRHLAANRGEGRVAIWDAVTGDEIATLDGPGPQVASLAYSPDGRRLAASGADGATIWSTSGFDVVTTVTPGRPVEHVEFRPDGNAVLVSGADGIAEYPLNGSAVVDQPAVVHLEGTSYFAAYRPGGSEVLRAADPSTTFDNPFVDIADAESGRFLEDLMDSGGEGLAVQDQLYPRPHAARFASDGDAVVLAGEGGAVVLDATSGYVPLAFQNGHGGPAWDAELSPQAAEAATVGADGTLRIWDPRTGVTRLVLPSGGATDLAYSPDGRRLAALGPNGAVTVFTLDVDELIATARARLTRTWTVAECEQYDLGETCMSLASASDVEAADGGSVEAASDTIAGSDTRADVPPEPADVRDDSPIDEATALSLGEELVAAMGTHDAEAARRLVAPDARFDVWYTDWGTDLDLLFDWLAASGTRIELDGCKLVDGDVARCTVDHRNAWSEALGVAPDFGTVTMTLGDELIDGVRYEFRGHTWVQAVVFEFIMFVDSLDPAAFDRMWTTEGDLLRPAATGESVELWKRYTADFVASVEG